MSRSADSDKLTSGQCYEKSTSALNEINNKSVVGNGKCDNLLSAAEETALTNLANDRKALDAQSTVIQNNLGSCQGDSDARIQESIDCYVTQVSFSSNFASRCI